MDDSLAASLGRSFEVPWPMQPNTTASNAVSVLWMAPGQWAIVDLPAAAVAERVAHGCGAALYHLADVSDGRVGFEISGELARDLFAKGCSLDLHARVFKPGACAQTLLAHIAVLLFSPRTLPGAERIYRLYADVSVAEHLRRWFQDAALEFTTVHR